MKRPTSLLCLLVLVAVFTTARAQNPLELIAQIDTASLAEYVSPLVKSYGCAMGTGWAHSAKSHAFLGFDLGVRLMVIQIPEAARAFDAHVRYCYFDSAAMDTVWRDTVIAGAGTLFGKRGLDNSWIPDGAIGIPPALPGGLGLSAMPFLVPQASLGLPIPGMEFTLRYVPWPFKGTTVQFLGLGLKQDFVALFGAKKSILGFAVQGFYQKLIVGDALNSNTLGGQALASIGLPLITPHIGFGFDKTTTNIKYTFKFNMPKVELGPPPHLTSEPVELPVSYSDDSGVRWRGKLGASLKLGIAFVSLDVNRDFTSGYNSVTVGTGITLR
jgi:hypothetical protein